MRRSLCKLYSLFLITVATTGLCAQESTAFTYQGRLLEKESPARGEYDFNFELFNAPEDGKRVAGPLVLSAVPVVDGLFTVVLDFGVPLTQEGRWLEIGVRPFGLEVFTTLIARQEMMPVPFAITATSVSPGAITSTMLAPGAVTTDKIAIGAVTGEQIDDAGRADYETFVDSVQPLGADQTVAFAQLRPVGGVSAPPPALGLTVNGLPFGEVVGFVGDEGISRTYSYVVQVRSSSDLGDPNLQIRSPASLTFVRNGRVTRFEGMVTAMAMASAERTEFLYSLRIEPALADLALTTDYQVNQSQAIPEVVADYYRQGTGAESTDLTVGNYPVHDNLIQYGESDLNFILRLLEHEGIFFFFDSVGSPPELVLGDGVSAYAAGSELTFAYYGDNADGIPVGTEFVRTFRRGVIQRTAIAEVKTYDFQNPNVDASGSSSSSSGWGTTYEFGTDIPRTEYAVQLAETRRFRHDVERLIRSGNSTAPDLRPGHVFELDDRSASGLGGSYLVTSVRHAAFVTEERGVRTIHYGNQFNTIPADVRYLPNRVTTRPQALPCTAVVTGPAGETIHVDEYGRVKVQFHWDRHGNHDDTSSAWLRVASPMAGPSHSMMFLPRIGDEVLVTFIQGDPDRPVIIGSLHNGTSPPPYELPAEKTKSTIRSSGISGQINEIRFEDAEGRQELMVHAARDMNSTVGNNLTTTVANDTTVSLGNDVGLSVGNTLTLDVAGEAAITSGLLSLSSPGVQIGGPMTIAGPLTADSSVSVDGSLAVNGALSIGRGTAFNMVQSGQASVPTSVTQTAVVTVAFPRRFGTVPKVVLTVGGNQKAGLDNLYAASVRTVSTTGFSVNIARLDAVSGWAQTLDLNWIAWE